MADMGDGTKFVPWRFSVTSRRRAWMGHNAGVRETLVWGGYPHRLSRPQNPCLQYPNFRACRVACQFPAL